MSSIQLGGRDGLGLRAPNPGPFTLAGTNSWLVGRDPTWLIDPGPAVPAHIDALEAEARARGGIEAILLTHDHADHSEAVPELRRRFPGARLFAARGDCDRSLGDGDTVGPLRALATPGHAPDHLAYIWDDVGLSGDAVLGQGSVFFAPDPGAMAAYLAALNRLKGLRLALLAPGHGPLVEDVEAHLSGYIEHRLDRERRLVAALAGGRRSVDELLEEVWDDAPAALRPAAAVTLAAHLDKLEDEGRLPEGVQRPGAFGL